MSVLATLRTKKLHEWQELFDHARAWEYGSVHPHNEIAEIIGVVAGSGKYYAVVRRCNKELLRKAQKWLEAVPGSGYRVITPDEHLKVAGKCMTQARRRISKGYAIAYATPVERLSSDGRVAWTGFIERTERFMAMVEAENHALAKIADGKAKLALSASREKMF
ncbi:hypothetical protein [Gelria sp. Kuro-4]|uniref:hypothetical protein n=1 Tax=Gelria sp. Kuro-4 TaxID=2796927 RepID=UPI001BF1346C|nr:hypothetical protein [Gelria sp. Kuro-4]BCV23329.1 hypothetical protein kuro4_01020 [Gelria sp. Kuro-4]